jgi:hypothetical protein
MFFDDRCFSMGFEGLKITADKGMSVVKTMRFPSWTNGRKSAGITAPHAEPIMLAK